METIKFSVLIPYYNEGESVIPTINSLQKQTYTNWELICVNDGSTDNTLDVLNNLSSKDNRIKVYTKENEGTPAKAINFGIDYLTGDYYFYSSKDDLFSQDFFESAYKVLSQNNYDAVYPNLYFHYSTHDSIFFSTNDKLALVVDGHYAAEMIAYGFKYPGNAFIRMSIVKKVGCYTFSYNSDEYTALKYMMSCKTIGFCKSVFYYTQDDPNAYTKKLTRNHFTGLETNIRKLELFKDYKNTGLLNYLRSYNQNYYCRLLIRYLQLIRTNTSCRVTKEDFKYFYCQYRNSIISAPVTNLKTLIIKSLVWNFDLLYFSFKTAFKFNFILCHFFRTKLC